MVTQAKAQTEEYDREAEESEKFGYLGGMEGAMKNQYKINEVFRTEAESLRLPQFCSASLPDLFHQESFVKLTKESLSNGFSLQSADSNVNFSLANDQMYAVDASNDGARYRKVTTSEGEYIRAQMERLPDEGRRRFCVDLIFTQLEKRKIGDVVPGVDMRDYVERIISGLSNDELASVQTGYQFYASRIQQKIETLLAEHREGRFFDLLESREVLCRPMFTLPQIITPVETLDGLESSLYESEAAVNAVERKIIEEVASLPNVRWWHRVVESKSYSFSINGFINHYPDFLVMTNKNTLVALEVKGDDRDNSDSERKLRLGRKWAEKSGEAFRYYMVFDNLIWSKEGAYDLSDFIDLMRKL
jgi:type III restriction enzyme